MKHLSSDFQYRKVDAVREKGGTFDPSFIVGIEVEAENATTKHPATTAWNPHTDGSLRNHGIEYTSIPLSGGAIDKYVEAFWKGLPPKWSFSQRTSIHVHVNIQDFTYDELARLLLLYCACEGIMFDFVGGDRQNSIFCTPLLDTQYPEEIIHKIISANAGVVMAWEKYSAVNLSRTQDLGTIEFRHMVGTRDLNKIMLWLHIIQCLYLYARKTSLADIKKLFERADDWTLMREIFTPGIQAVFGAKEVRRLFKRGISAVVLALVGEGVRKTLISSLSPTSNFQKYKAQI